MDGIHDLGGMEGFGPVQVTFDENVFPDLEDWEKRMWALSQAVSVPGSTIDWFRHVVELMVPKDYLTFPYFNKWCTTHMVMWIDKGDASIGDFEAGNSASAPQAASLAAVEEIIQENRRRGFSFNVPSDASPAFSVGDVVRTVTQVSPGHTRLPRYARGKVGTVIACHGCHPLPDESAQGREVPEHLYTVKFDAQTLWGPDANPRDSVSLELWESYLVSA